MTRLFTGQRLDSTGLYYYGARYYDATIGRFISPDISPIFYGDLINEKTNNHGFRHHIMGTSVYFIGAVCWNRVLYAIYDFKCNYDCCDAL
jgi:RHS repeat-associated protein